MSAVLVLVVVLISRSLDTLKDVFVEGVADLKSAGLICDHLI